MPTQMSRTLAAFSVAAAGLGLVACSTHTARTSALGARSGFQSKASSPTGTWSSTSPTEPVRFGASGRQTASNRAKKKDT
jgi:hypothetical protein